MPAVVVIVDIKAGELGVLARIFAKSFRGSLVYWGRLVALRPSLFTTKLKYAGPSNQAAALIPALTTDWVLVVPKVAQSVFDFASASLVTTWPGSPLNPELM